jgi:CAAX amino terminal protease family.
MEVYTTDGAIDTIYAIITFAVLPAVCEEFLFRSVLAAEYEKSGVGCAVFMSSAMFAMLHFNVQLLPVYFVSGLILMLVMYTTRSVLGSMAVHIANNIFSIYFEDYIWKMLSRPQNTAIVVFILSALLLLFLVIMFSEAERIYHNYGVMNVKSTYAEKPAKKRKSGEPNLFVKALISPPFILLAIFFIIACAFI